MLQLFHSLAPLDGCISNVRSALFLGHCRTCPLFWGPPAMELRQGTLMAHLGKGRPGDVRTGSHGCVLSAQWKRAHLSIAHLAHVEPTVGREILQPLVEVFGCYFCYVDIYIYTYSCFWKESSDPACAVAIGDGLMVGLILLVFSSLNDFLPMIRLYLQHQALQQPAFSCQWAMHFSLQR